jgi:hypothetical protein
VPVAGLYRLDKRSLIMANLLLTMGKSLLKHTLRLGTLTGLERLMVSSVTLADRAATS